MLSKLEKIWIKSLKDKKNRYDRNEFIAEGARIVLDLMKAAPENLKLICTTQAWHTKFEHLLVQNEEKVRIITEDVLHSVASLSSTEEVLAIFDFPKIPISKKVNKDFIIYLDNIRDPGNLGSIIRSADWFGITKIYCSPGCVDPYNNKCVQATMSSIMRVEVIHLPWAKMVALFNTKVKFAATAEGESIYNFKKDAIDFICIGNEANGLSPEIIRDCKACVSIPSNYSLGAESLNAAVACSVIMSWKSFG